MSVPSFTISTVNESTELAPFETFLYRKNSLSNFFQRVFGQNMQMVIEKLIVNPPLKWHAKIRSLNKPAAWQVLVFPRIVFESLEHS